MFSVWATAIVKFKLMALFKTRWSVSLLD